VQQPLELAGQDRGAEPPEVLADDHGTLPPPETHDPGPPGNGTVVVVGVIDLNGDLSLSAPR